MGLKERFKVVVGGAPVLPEWAKEIGADGYGKDFVQAVSVFKELTPKR
jgi:methanogenic corrinoid protein MtbC1